MAPSKVTTKPSDIPQEVPMFLRKTYHMIDSCDPTVACWSEDGETFVVKDPSKFESEIIPQFFKHSKFTSFVRQLNFYSFRKIKYVDTIRLDPKLEAETANFWRFRHEKFQRGKPHLLTEIKRMTASQNRAAAEKAAKAAAAGGANNNSATAAAASDNTQMKQEIDSLKKRLEEMNKNMNELTSMVQKVSLKEEEEQETTSVHAGNKRKKVEIVAPVPEPVMSTPVAPAAAAAATPTEPLPEPTLDMFPPMDMDMDMDMMDAALDGMKFAPPSPEGLGMGGDNARTTSTTSNMTDADFVDQLFDAFGGSDTEQEQQQEQAQEAPVVALPEPAAVTSMMTTHPGKPIANNNRPDPELMDRLSEALAVLPKEMQHQIVNRLIASITSNLVAPTGAKAAADVIPTPKKHDDEDGAMEVLAQATPVEGATAADTMGMPLAAATLASLLKYYSTLVKDKQIAVAGSTPVTPVPAAPTTVIPSCHAEVMPMPNLLNTITPRGDGITAS